MPTPPLILLVSGSLRAGSSNAAVLGTAQAVAPSWIRTRLYEGLGALPHFNPDDDRDPLPAPVASLRAAVEEADAVLICTPEYAGTLPGSFKNLLDWTVGGTEICDKPVAWVTAAAPGRGQGAEATLRLVLGYTGAAVVESACARIPVAPQIVGEDGLITDPDVREQIGKVLALLAEGAAAVSRSE
ncbi:MULTISPECIES: NADPH-dependent FMN reductase [Streptomyces]|uniref:NAD(P)H-dependent oxidoreductase n=1 Tax=Streptomyces solicathayae TaxID=3081768 RepID=A0ABZ0LUM4_9ACTN|nr:NAD(P)H-dependent oxidoreductase [Streptomyces sp. HUAS YS2]WOX23117.1 NAD(P)H-dependent oxidoreductase [Streptomyces sp. HUAS YS2]